MPETTEVPVEVVEDHPIYHAIQDEDKELVAQMIRDDPSVLSISAYKWDGTPLIYAILDAEDELESGDEMALHIIELGSKKYWGGKAQTQGVNHRSGMTPLIAACLNVKQPAIVKKLVEKGVDPTVPWRDDDENEDGEEESNITPLLLTVEDSSPDSYESFAYLLTLPSVRATLTQLHRRQNIDRSMLGAACQQMDVVKIQMLLEAGADASFAGKNCQSNADFLRSKIADCDKKAKDQRDKAQAALEIIQASIDESVRARWVFRARFLEDAKILVSAKQALGGTRVRPVDEFVQHRREREEALPVVEIRTSETAWKELAVNIWKYDMYDYEVEVERARHRMQVGDEGDVVKKALELPDDLFEGLMEMMVPPGDFAWKGEALGKFLDRLEN